MPKRYRIEMKLFDVDSGEEKEIARSTHRDRYNDDGEAKGKFREKTEAAEKAGKGLGDDS